jgi:rhodanese-related sulfurtransferase
MKPMHPTAEIPEVDPHEASARIAAGAFHVDVREPDEIRAKRIPGAVALPLSSFGEAYEAALPEDLPIVVSCRSGARSGRVTSFLIEHGYDAVNLAGGILAWEAQGLPVEHG